MPRDLLWSVTGWDCGRRYHCVTKLPGEVGAMWVTHCPSEVLAWMAFLQEGHTASHGMQASRMSWHCAMCNMRDRVRGSVLGHSHTRGALPQLPSLIPALLRQVLETTQRCFSHLGTGWRVTQLGRVIDRSEPPCPVGCCGVPTGLHCPFQVINAVEQGPHTRLGPERWLQHQG